MEIALVLVVGAMCILCFMLGAKVGQKVVKGEPVELPNLDPFKAYREHEARKAQREEQERLNTVLRNIDRYDGTGNGQEDVPRG
jgi:hypothetical protein